jgi:O-methyltransferase
MDYIKTQVLKTIHLKGEIAEAGVWKGESAKAICEVKGGKSLYLFDTFTGLPETMFTPVDTETPFNKLYLQPNAYSGSLEEVKERLIGYENVQYYKGLIPYTFKGLKRKKYSFIHIDLDLYKSTREALKYFLPRRVTGGIIMIHNYHDFRGIRLALRDMGISDEIQGDHKYCLL